MNTSAYRALYQLLKMANTITLLNYSGEQPKIKVKGIAYYPENDYASYSNRQAGLLLINKKEHLHFLFSGTIRFQQNTIVLERIGEPTIELVLTFENTDNFNLEHLFVQAALS